MTCGPCDRRIQRLNAICADYLEAVDREDAETMRAIEREAAEDPAVAELLRELRESGGAER